MDNQVYININGELELAGEDKLSVAQRALHYGDGLFESMHAFGTQVPLFDLHHKRLLAGMKALRFLVNEKFKKQQLAFEIERVLKRNKQFAGARVRLTVFRNAAGLYTPDSHEAAYLIETSTLPYKFFKLNDKGLSIGIFTDLRKPINYLSPFKTCNALLNIMAGIHAAENQWDDCLIINENYLIVEGYHSNIFMYKEGKLLTPGVESGCVMGVMREMLIRLARQQGIHTFEPPGFTEEDLLSAEEIFLTNAVEGIRWVVAYKNRRYFNRVSTVLNDQLNTSLFSKHL